MIKTKIVDEFTNLNVSRQRKCQLRHAKAGLCQLCSEPVAMGVHCLKHHVIKRERFRLYVGSKRRNRSKSYRLEREAKKK